MELELQYTELSCCEAGESVTLTQEEALEAAIPEYCPEVTRIVDAVGQLCLREYTSRQISGSVLVTVLYTSEESPGLRSLTLPVPFLTQADDKRLTGCDTVCMAGRLLLTEARAVTGRKLYLRVMPELTLTGYTCRRHRICTGVGEEPTLRLHRQEQSLTLLTSVTQRQSSVTQELQPQDWGEPPEELLAQRICPRITGSQPVGSRLLAKGEARILPAVPHAGRLPPHMGGHPALFLPSGRPYRPGGGAGHGHRLLRHGPAYPQRRRSRHRGGADPEPTGADL